MMGGTPVRGLEYDVGLAPRRGGDGGSSMRGVGGSSTSEFGGAVPSITRSWGAAFGIGVDDYLHAGRTSSVLR